MAIKRIAPEHARLEELGPLHLGALRAEGALLARIAHPNVIHLVETIEDPPALVLELLSGHTLTEVCAQGPLPLELVLEVCAQAAAALSAVHAARDEAGPLGAVHRDLAPDNLFLTNEGRVVLFDFGVAAFRGGAEDRAGALKGRVAYMAPEQARGERVEGSADVFALGVVLWELLVGRRLFWRGNTLATLRALLDEPIPSPRQDVAMLPELEALVLAMLARDAGARPSVATVEEQLRALTPVEAAAALAARARSRVL